MARVLGHDRGTAPGVGLASLPVTGVVTIDGPSGTGKSTVSKLVADRLGLPHLDTGAFYRAATLAALENEVDLDDEAAVVDVVVVSRFEQESDRMFLDGKDVSDEIRSERVTSGVSVVSAHPRVRAMLVEFQRAWVDEHSGDAVVEGRDIGSVVFPDARHKIYLDARPEVRAARRARQEGVDPDLALAALRRRDHIDSTREASPLMVPGGSVVVDTSDLTIEEVVDRIVTVVETAGS